jgi:hypothetical protein
MSRIIILVILFLTLGIGGFYLYNNYFNRNTSKQLETLSIAEVADLGFFIQDEITYNSEETNEKGETKNIVTKTKYKYYSYGKVPSGNYEGFDIYIVEHNESSFSRQFGGYTIADKDEFYDYELIAAKDGKFVSYREYDDSFLSLRVENYPEKYLGFEIFPLPTGMKKEYQTDELNTLKYEGNIFSLFKRLQENSENKLTKLPVKLDGFDTYEFKNTLTTSDGYKIITKKYLIDFKGLAVFYYPTIGGYNYDLTIPASILNLPNQNYKTYNYFRTPCSFELTDLNELDSSIISPNNLEKINTSGNFNVFKIRDLNEPANQKLVERIKDIYYYQDYEKLNLDYDSKPNINDLKDNGVLVYQDFFGVYRGLVQNNTIETRGGCGKPVVYLYPEKDTKVTLSFVNHMQFTTVIPSYQNSWEVLAHSNGILNDLKPEITNCNSFGNKIGSEYAKNACEKNEYPYLYWSGNTISNFYPQALTGFIVKKEDLDSFFDEKLSQINFNQKEINDFKEYWVLYLSNKDSEYFRISFFQNDIVNKLFPMNVNPKPQSQIRMFMDWDYASKETNISKQNLISYPRTGFTLVEWGGLKK